MDRETVEKWLNDRNLTMAPKEMFTADGLEFLFDTNERQAKAIVALSGMLDLILESDMAMREEDEGETNDELEMARNCLSFHADAIKRARGKNDTV